MTTTRDAMERMRGYRGDNSYETDMGRPFRISHRGGRGQDFDRSVSVRLLVQGQRDGAATLLARTRNREVIYEGDCGDGSGCGNGRGEAGGAARAAGGDKRRGCSDSCVGIHRG